MKKHYLVLTIDTDPDDFNFATPDRSKLVWDGLEFAIDTFHDAFPDYPLTWYVRADGQLEHTYGSLRYLLDEYADFWQKAINRGDELGWHPHLYTLPEDDSQPEIITDSTLAVPELKRIWQQIRDVPFDLKSFRMGESWHTAETLNLIEQFGFSIDSSAISGRDDSANGHPRNWSETPNRPYYPDKNIPRLEGQKRDLLEIPMNSWFYQASYDKAPKLRYLNPCIHSDLWEQALNHWKTSLNESDNTIWVMIWHPVEAMPRKESDFLYAFSLETMQYNLRTMESVIKEAGHNVEWITVSDAARYWKNRDS